MKKVTITKSDVLAIRAFIKELKKTKAINQAVIVAFARVTGEFFGDCHIIIGERNGQK